MGRWMQPSRYDAITTSIKTFASIKTLTSVKTSETVATSKTINTNWGVVDAKLE